MAPAGQGGLKHLVSDVGRPSEGRIRLRTELAKVAGRMEPGHNCAYNHTRDCFLGMHVVAGDFTQASFRDWLAMLRPNSGYGVWMVPFRGIGTTEVSAPLDLLYLDADGRVQDVVEFFPTFKVSPSSPPAASVLVLPSHSIFSSQSQRGDRLVIALPEQLEWRLDQLGPVETPTPASMPIVAQGPVLVRDEPKKLGSLIPMREPIAGPTGLALVREEVREERTARLPQVSYLPQQPVAETEPLKAEVAPAPVAPPMSQRAGEQEKPKRGWLSRWLSPEPGDARKSARQPVAGLVAHFFTGGAPVAHEIRDVSSTGLYVITTERWYPGTIIRMTLSKPDVGQPPAERSITIQAESMRWGNDGVGLRFVLAAQGKSAQGISHELGTVDSRQLGQFLKGVPTVGRSG
jgi:uncharacterized protein